MQVDSRRKFLIAGGASLCLASLGACKNAGQVSEERHGTAELMHYSELPLGMSLHTVERLVMLHDARGAAAFSLLCTHQTCLLTQEISGEGFVCPCHGSQFDKLGRVLAGPATVDLPWYGLTLLSNGIIQIDFSKHVTPDWRLALS